MRANAELEQGREVFLPPADLASLRSRLLLMAAAGGLASALCLVVHACAFSPDRGGQQALIPLLFHAAGTTFLLSVGLLIRCGPLRLSYMLNVESAGLLGAIWSFALMGSALPSARQSEWLVLLILTYVLAARAAIVPSTVMRTLTLAVLAGLPLIPLALARSGGGLPWRSEQPAPAERSLAVWIGVFWLVSGAVSVLFSWVLYRLRLRTQAAEALGQYHLRGEIGRGGMGVVYEARHAMLQRPTALKLLNGRALDGEALARFEREVRLTARLSHPHTVTVFDFGRTVDGVSYYAMELLDGLPLHEVVRQDGPLPVARAVDILRQAAEALAEAHGSGLVHRDIKPSNIMLCRYGGLLDFVKVLDFGLVKDSADRASFGVTLTGAFLGSPLYMAPEGFQGAEHLTAQADLYALGAVGYYLLTGRHVFDGRSLLEIGQQHLQAPVPPFTGTREPVPEELQGLLRQCLEKDPARRPASMREVVRRLSALACPSAWTAEDRLNWWRHIPPRGRTSVGETPDRPAVVMPRRRPVAERPTATEPDPAGVPTVTGRGGVMRGLSGFVVAVLLLGSGCAGLTPAQREAGKRVAAHMASAFDSPEHHPFVLRGGSNAALFVHGFPGSPAQVRPLAEALRTRGWTVS